VKGLYLNVPDAERHVRLIDEGLGVPTHLAKIEHGRDRITVSYHPICWPSGPIFSAAREERTAAASGWFAFRGRVGDLEGFATSFWSARDPLERIRVLGDLEAGAYTVLLLRGDERVLITDPFGLHPHYYAGGNPFDRVAPSPFFIKGDQVPDPAVQHALDRQGHLFGNLTAYQGILRLDPNALIDRTGVRHHFDWGPRVDGGPHPLDALRRSLARFDNAPCVLPISGGLDSRLLLAARRFDYGYTFGPPETGDRPVARRFRHHFRDYHEFSLLDLEYPDTLRETGRRLLDGVCGKPFFELLAVYQMLYKRWGEGCFFFDGYAGDVLQRGLYMTYGGLKGSLAKLFPAMTRHRFDAEGLLLRRYPGLDLPTRDLLIEAYRRFTKEWKLTDARRLVLFELLYGRGARYILDGGTILSGQFYPPVQPFLIPEVFRSLWQTDPLDAMTYKALRPIWQEVPAELSDVRTYSGFKPTSNPDVARATMLLVKGLGRASLMKRSVSYEVERSRVRWRKSE
jgi:hypothetical protein